MYETANQKKPTGADTITILLNCKALVEILLNPSEMITLQQSVNLFGQKIK